MHTNEGQGGGQPCRAAEDPELHACSRCAAAGPDQQRACRHETATQQDCALPPCAAGQGGKEARTLCVAGWAVRLQVPHPHRWVQLQRRYGRLENAASGTPRCVACPVAFQPTCLPAKLLTRAGRPLRSSQASSTRWPVAPWCSNSNPHTRSSSSRPSRWARRQRAGHRTGRVREAVASLPGRPAVRRAADAARLLSRRVGPDNCDSPEQCGGDSPLGLLGSPAGISHVRMHTRCAHSVHSGTCPSCTCRVQDGYHVVKLPAKHDGVDEGWFRNFTGEPPRARAGQRRRVRHRAAPS